MRAGRTSAEVTRGGECAWHGLESFLRTGQGSVFIQQERSQRLMGSAGGTPARLPLGLELDGVWFGQIARLVGNLGRILVDRVQGRALGPEGARVRLWA